MVKKKTAGKWVVGTLTAVILLLAAFAGICIYVDPFCHYHAPLRGYDYTSLAADYGASMYMNDGIIRLCNYGGIITGSSMTENFKTSEAESLFGVRFIKIPLAGSGFKEMNTQLERVYERGKSPKYVIRSLDDYAIEQNKDETRRDLSEGEYLYNNNVFDDVNYLFNLEVFLKYTCYILSHPSNGGGESFLDFDNYCSWSYPTGKEAVLKNYTAGSVTEKTVFTPEDREQLLENIRCNITDFADAHPETTFVWFFPPYSICNWEKLSTANSLQWTIEANRTSAEELLKCPNIKLFGFDNHYDIVCDLDNYKDPKHYCADVNSEILKMMADGTSMLTIDNYEDYFSEIERFYGEYDYSRLWE